MAKGDPGFTRYNVAGCVLALVLWLEAVFPVLLCTSVGVFVGFHMAPVMDRTAFHRLAASEELSFPAFLVGNFVLHILPLLVMAGVVMLWQLEVYLHHAVTAVVVHLGWGVAVSRRQHALDHRHILDMSHIYATMRHHEWLTLWVCAVFATLTVPIAL